MLRLLSHKQCAPIWPSLSSYSICGVMSISLPFALHSRDLRCFNSNRQFSCTCTVVFFVVLLEKKITSRVTLHLGYFDTPWRFILEIWMFRLRNIDRVLIKRSAVTPRPDSSILESMPTVLVLPFTTDLETSSWQRDCRDSGHFDILLNAFWKRT